MENFNRVLSFALGLVVVVVFLAIISGRINLGKKLPFLSGKTSAKVTPSPSPTTPAQTQQPTITNTQYQNQVYPTTGKTITTKTIPATGSPTILVPILLSVLTGGLFLRSATKSRNF